MASFSSVVDGNDLKHVQNLSWQKLEGDVALLTGQSYGTRMVNPIADVAVSIEFDRIDALYGPRPLNLSAVGPIR